MDIFANLVSGITGVMTPTNLLFLGIGVVVGMLVGAIPGLGPSAGLAILLPLTFGLEPTTAIVMLAAVYYGAMYGGTITSVLINTPGDSASVPATLEGYPMARKGRAGPALVIAAVGSFAAGTVAVVLLTIAAPLMAGVASSFGPPELFLLIIIGLLTLVVLVGRSWLRGLISVLIGFAIGTVGIDVGGGEQRYTFGSTELINGIDFIPVAIGLFGIGEILWTLYRGGHNDDTMTDVRVDRRSAAFWPSRQEWRDSRGAIARGTPLGFVLGVVPGAGATVASLISYGIEKGLSRRPQRFGRGAVEGLAGPEAANNAAATGAMVPLLTLGIPGSASTAVLLGGFLMWGLQPGPLLMRDNPDFAWGLIGSMYLGNVMLLVMNVFCIPLFAKVTKTPFRTLAPLIIILCAFGTFAVNGSVVEVGIMFACGVLGFLMRRYGLAPAATVIALVLGPMAEETLRQTLLLQGGLGLFVERTPSLVLLCVLVLLLCAPVLSAPLKRAAAALMPRRAAARAAGEAGAAEDAAPKA
ncbi:tripartite tricarboxylate transporter permease [Streptomonospora nanhaiensis]|uniref:tripartite tricarboxylate transporter permease n=1 Tax=Streptomonospora nanhaiensis TaxID=1323731 RepID=UPI001C388054|nr:tripartite tricarboxylate transporter permease [Streptomonospora nanhaiensis]MBV2365404.1 tripartite tricarboxylate transporter permease [Streptomonospora nanhaiensis]MBX9390205.1 tripartite tricarboxylate transporter permease [Streptomonospora nanhaiensis]